MSRRKGVMLCYPFEEKRLEKWTPPYLVQPKLEGERCKTLSIASPAEVNETVLVSSEENIITSVPHINRAIRDRGLQNISFDGELYIHGRSFDGPDGIHAICGRTVNLHEDHEAMQYHIFDLVSEEPQWARIRQLQFTTLEHPLKRVPTYYADNLEKIMEISKWYVDDGYEGIIVRHIDAPYIQRRSTFVMKFKPKKKDWYLISDILESFTKEDRLSKGMVGAIECIDDMGTTFKTAPGLGWTEERKRKLWHNRHDAIGKWCEVHYQNITSGKGVPYFGVFVEIVDVNPERVSPLELPV